MIIWQDIAISIANFVFFLALLSQVTYGFKKKKGTMIMINSLPTSIALYVIGIAFFTLDLWLSGIVAISNGTLWFVLFIQRIIYKKA